jgi:hypothetical protein
MALAASIAFAAHGQAATRARDRPFADDPVLSACADRSLPTYTMTQRQVVRVVDATGWTRESTRMVYWKHFDNGQMKMLFRVELPANESGLSALIVKREDADPVLYVYTPDIGRPRRMAGNALSSSILGTDFSYEDAVHLQGFADAASVRRLEDADVDGHPAHVIETHPDEETSAYSRIRSYVDQALCIPVKTEFFGHNGTLHKTLVVVRDSVREVNGRAVPQRSVMYNFKKNSHSIFDVTDVEIDTELRDGLFTFAEVKKSH